MHDCVWSDNVTSLKQLQRAFAANLVAEKTLLHDGLFSVDKIPIERLVNVYRNNSRTSLRAALAAVYPVIQKLVGPEFFRYLADRYARDYPLRSGDLRGFGRYLPDFLSNFDLVSTLPYIGDVADVEWAYQIVTLAGPLESSDPVFWRKHTSIQLPDLRFNLAPACCLVCSSYPIFSIWKVNQDGYPGDNTANLEEGPQSVLVLRSTNEIELWRLQDPEATFVRSLATGATLGATVEAMIALGHNFNLEILLLKYVQSGCLVAANIDQLSVGEK